MEFDFPSILLLLFPSLFIIFKILHMITKPENEYASSSLLLNRIPGPKKLPVIGNLHLLVGKTPPHHIFRDLASKHRPLMRLQLGGVPFLIVSSVEAAKQVLKTHDAAFANRPPVFAFTKMYYNNTNIALAPHGEYWRQLRKICTLELLSKRRVKSFHPIIKQANSDLADWIASNEGSPVNLSERVLRSAFDITASVSIGKESEEKEAMSSAIHELMTKLGSSLSLADLYPSYKLLPVITGLNFKIERIFRRIDGILQRIIDDHRAAKAGRSEDLVDILLKFQEEEDGVHLSDDNIKAVILDMFIAGADSYAIVVYWAMSGMVRNPTTLKMAQDEVRRVFDGNGYVDEEKFEELNYLKLVIKETLRMYPPGPLLVPRINSERCEINGYEIPANTRLLVNAWTLGRDPKYWNDGEKFKPERFEDTAIDFSGNNLKYIPFGSGRRICPGMLFGLANVEFLLATLLFHFDWKMVNGMKNEELDMSEDFNVSLTRKHDLVLIPTLKRPLVV